MCQGRDSSERTRVVVLVDSLQPADVVVRVRHEMHVQHPGEARVARLREGLCSK